MLYIVSTVLALLGLVLLFLAKPEASEQQYVLTGTVLSVRGREAIVEAKVDVIGKQLRTGETISTPVFWNGNEFVMVWQ